MRRILNSRVTWIVLPLVISGLVIAAATRARQPVSDRVVDRLLGQLYQNAMDDPKVPWEHLQSGSSMLSVETLISISNWLYPEGLSRGSGSVDDPSTIENMAARVADDPEAFSKIDAACFSDVSAFIQKNAKACFLDENVTRSRHEHLLKLGATSAARAGDNDKALSRLRLMIKLEEMKLARYTGTNAAEVARLFSVFEDVAAETTVPAHLRRLCEELEHTRSLQQPTRPSINLEFPNLVYRMMSEPELTERKNIVKIIGFSGKVLATEKPDAWAQSPDFDWIYGDTYDIGHIVPWTRNPYVFYKTMNDLAEQLALTAAVPEAYLKGLSGEQRLMAAALLLEPAERRKAYYISDRANVTRRKIIQAAMLARVHLFETGALPTRLEELARYDYLPPAATDLDALRRTLHHIRESEHVPERDVPMGPLEILQVVPSGDDLDQWLDGETMVRLRSIAEADEGSTLSRRQIALAPANNFGSESGFAGNLRKWIERLDSRADVHVTSFTVFADEPNELENIFWHPDDPPLRKVRATVEFIAPTQVSKIQLRDPQLELPFNWPSSGMRPQAMYLAPPVPQQ